MGKPLDFEAARADLRGKIAANDAAQAKVRDRLGALALDVTLGNAKQADLDAATSEDARLASNGAALEQALAEVDRREAAHLEQEAAEKRRADEAEYGRLMTMSKTASAQAVDLVGKLATVVADAVEAENKAVAIARRLDLQPASTRRGHVVDDLATLMGARLHEYVPTLGYTRATHGDEAASRLRSVVS